MGRGAVGRLSAATAFHPPGAPVPADLRTERLWLRPLRVADTARDYEAVMASAEQLRAWSQSPWPEPDFTLALNRADLERHEREHAEGVAFTYTVLDPEGALCLGCVYIKPPLPEAAAVVAGAMHPADVGFWVRSDATAPGLDAELLMALRAWLARDWRFDRVVFGLSPRAARQAALLEAAGASLEATVTRPDGRSWWVFA